MAQSRQVGMNGCDAAGASGTHLPAACNADDCRNASLRILWIDLSNLRKQLGTEHWERALGEGVAGGGASISRGSIQEG